MDANTTKDTSLQQQKSHVQGRISRIRQRRATPVDTDGDTADQVAHADGKAGPEEGEAGVVGLGVVQLSALDAGELGGEDNGHDDAVDGDDLAEDNGDEVLGADARGADATADDRGAGDEDTPIVNIWLERLFYGAAPTSRLGGLMSSYHAAPTTDRPMQREMPKLAQPTGDMDSRNAPTWMDTLLDRRGIRRRGPLSTDRRDIH